MIPYKEIEKWFDEFFPPDCFEKDCDTPIPGWISGTYCLFVEEPRPIVDGVVVDEENMVTPIYIGKSVNIRNRLQAHAGQPSHPPSKAHGLWWDRSDEVCGFPAVGIRRIVASSERARIEIEAIESLRPLANRVDNKKGRESYGPLRAVEQFAGKETLEKLGEHLGKKLGD